MLNTCAQPVCSATTLTIVPCAKPFMPTYQLVIFDFDGTLADSGSLMIRTLNDLAGQFGLRRVSDDEVQMLRGRSNTEIVRYLGVPLWKLPKIASEMRKRITADIDQIKLFAGVDDMLRTLDCGAVRLAIVSSNSEENVRRVLGAENSARIDVFDCSAAMFGKASKLRSVMRRLGIAPQATLYVGDETRDIEAAHEVSVACGVVTWGYAKPELLASFKPTLTFNDMSEIGSLVA
jgi:phosphoglycolate phosphatase